MGLRGNLYFFTKVFQSRNKVLSIRLMQNYYFSVFLGIKNRGRRTKDDDEDDKKLRIGYKNMIHPKILIVEDQEKVANTIGRICEKESMVPVVV